LFVSSKCRCTGAPLAQYELADALERGEGITKDVKQAIKWYRKAADQGDKDAQAELGRCYFYGIGVERDHATLTDRPSISGFDSSFGTSYTTRGNVTGTTSYLLVNGAVTGSISAYSQFDG